MREMESCSYCGKEMGKEEEFCSHCDHRCTSHARSFFYVAEGYNDTDDPIEFESTCVSVKYIAEEAVDHYYHHHDGWDGWNDNSWNCTLTLYADADCNQCLGAFECSAQTTLYFTANKRGEA
jgi:hypothetical protein